MSIEKKLKEAKQKIEQAGKKAKRRVGRVFIEAGTVATLMTGSVGCGEKNVQDKREDSITASHEDNTIQDTFMYGGSEISIDDKGSVENASIDGFPLIKHSKNPFKKDSLLVEVSQNVEYEVDTFDEKPTIVITNNMEQRVWPKLLPEERSKVAESAKKAKYVPIARRDKNKQIEVKEFHCGGWDVVTEVRDGTQHVEEANVEYDSRGHLRKRKALKQVDPKKKTLVTEPKVSVVYRIKERE